MSVRETIVCDFCGGELDVHPSQRTHYRVSFETGKSRACAAGGSTEDITEELDLCHKCAISVARLVISKLGIGDQILCLQRVKDLRKHG